MQISHQALAQHLQRKIYPINVIVGQDNFLIEDASHLIRSNASKLHDSDEKTFSIQSAEDWNMLIEEASHYSLFYDQVILTVNYDKKTLDSAGKKRLTEYISSINPRCIIIIKAPNLGAKQLQWLSQDENALLVLAQPLTAEAMKKWITQQLLAQAIQFEKQVPELIYQYTKGNMLASAQVIEKIALVYEPNSLFSSSDTIEQLTDQCDYTIFELIDAFLAGQVEQGIHILKQAANNKTEPTLVLWMLTQEIRTLLQLIRLGQQGMDFRKACGELNIWTQRVNNYQQCIKRVNQALLQHLHHYCCMLDNRIKTSGNHQVWNGLETVFLSLCIGKLIGDACSA